MMFPPEKFSISKREFSSLTRFVCILFILSGLLVASPATGQSLSRAPSGNTTGVYGGAGITTLGPGLTAGISARRGGHQFLIRGISTDTDPAEETWEIAGLYGRVIAIRSFQLSAGAGVGVVGGTGYSRLFASGNREDFETMLGFPLEGRITWNPVRQAGLGLHSFANVNTVQPFGGVALTLHVSL